MRVSAFTDGGISYEYARNMPYAEMEIVLAELKKIDREREKAAKPKGRR